MYRENGRKAILSGACRVFLSLIFSLELCETVTVTVLHFLSVIDKSCYCFVWLREKSMHLKGMSRKDPQFLNLKNQWNYVILWELCNLLSGQRK